MDTSSRALLGLKTKEKPKTFMSFALVVRKAAGVRATSKRTAG